MSRIKKGQHALLNVTQKATHRVFVGLGWDPNKKTGLRGKIGEKLGGKKTFHDLDLSCFMYDGYKTFLGKISAKLGKCVDETGHIYHSGDNLDGFGGGDDEQISVELKNIAQNVHHIIFKASIKSGHVFGEIEQPKIRITDGYSNHNFLKTAIDHEHGANTSTFVFVNIYRNGEDSWKIHNIGQYLTADDIENREEELKKYL